MNEKRFIWLAGSCEASINGRRLEQGETYAVVDFSAEVVAEWVRSGAAKYVKPGKDKPGEEE